VVDCIVKQLTEIHASWRDDEENLFLDDTPTTRLTPHAYDKAFLLALMIVAGRMAENRNES
jgi:hypothetical protein